MEVDSMTMHTRDQSGLSQHESVQPPQVVVHGLAIKFTQNIEVGGHRLVSDEPTAVGGDDAGPTPCDLLLAALGSCTSMTLGLYARRKQWPLESATVKLRHTKVHAVDCAECHDEGAMLDHIDCEIELHGLLTDEQ